MKLQIGDWVRIKGHWNFPDDCTGTIAQPPESVRKMVQNCEPWEGHYRTVNGVKGPIEFVWVTFDTPQKDGDGDGPYTAGEIQTDFITKTD